MTQPLRLSPISIPSNPTTTTTDTSTPPKTLPPLPYTPSDHKRSIALTWTIVVTNSCLLPIALVYGLWYGTSLSKNTVFGIVTGVFGALSLVQFWWRMWKLLKKDGEFRPLGSRRGWLDFYQINTMLSIVIVAVGNPLFFRSSLMGSLLTKEADPPRRRHIPLPSLPTSPLLAPLRPPHRHFPPTFPPPPPPHRFPHLLSPSRLTAPAGGIHNRRRCDGCRRGFGEELQASA